MKKLLKIIPILLLTTLFLQSCDNDDETVSNFLILVLTTSNKYVIHPREPKLYLSY